MVGGKYAVKPGEAKNSWLTGTAAWNFVAISQFILGVRPTFDGLLIDPCIPKELRQVKLTRKFRGNTYEITMDNTSGNGCGVREITIDGKKADCNVLKSTDNGNIHEIKIVL